MIFSVDARGLIFKQARRRLRPSRQIHTLYIEARTNSHQHSQHWFATHQAAALLSELMHSMLGASSIRSFDRSIE